MLPNLPQFRSLSRAPVGAPLLQQDYETNFAKRVNLASASDAGADWTVTHSFSTSHTVYFKPECKNFSMNWR